VSTGVFQMLSAGSTGQPPIICCAEAGAAIAAAARRAGVARVMTGEGNRRAAGGVAVWPRGRVDLDAPTNLQRGRAVLTGIRLETLLGTALDRR
jgi:hypothetical protein